VIRAVAHSVERSPVNVLNENAMLTSQSNDLGESADRLGTLGEVDALDRTLRAQRLENRVPAPNQCVCQLRHIRRARSFAGQRGPRAA
jgi:hypothetical protein